MIWNRDVEFKIVKIQWERIFLNIEIETEYRGEVSFAFSRFKRLNLQQMEAKEAGVTVEEMFDPAVEPDYEFEIKESYNIDIGGG